MSAHLSQMIAMFFGLLIILAIASAIVLYYLVREEKLHTKRESEHKIRIVQLENELSKKDKETEKVLTQVKNDFSDKEQKLNTQILELKNQLLQSQDALRKENLNKLNLETKITELQARVIKLSKDLSTYTEMHKGLKGQYDELEREMEKLREELANKDTALKTEQSLHQQLKEKYDTLLKTTNTENLGDEPRI